MKHVNYKDWRTQVLTCSGFTLGPDHGGPFSNAAKSFSEVPGAADERDLEAALVDVMLVVGGSQD